MIFCIEVLELLLRDVLHDFWKFLLELRPLLLITLVDLHQVSGTILQQALCTGEFLLKNSQGILAGLMKKMWYNQADMMPLSKRVQEAQIRRFIDG